MAHLGLDDCVICDGRGSLPRFSLVGPVPFGMVPTIPTMTCPFCKGTGSEFVRIESAIAPAPRAVAVN